MRLAIDGGGYAAAATAFRDGNHVAAMQYDSLTGKLAGFGAMAGDDSTSTEFVAAYDDAARESLAALGELVDAFAGLGHLTEQSVTNHLDAERHSIINGASVYEGASLGESYVSVLPSQPPSALGGDPPLLPEEAAWVLDHIEGFVWPSADTARLRDAAHAWRTAAEGIEELTTYCDGAIGSFESQRSPEIPLAIDATSELRTTIRGIADQYAALASACDTYADHVDAKHAEIRALLTEILAMIVEGIVISAAIGLITAGAGAAAAGAAVVARVMAQSPRFAAILTALRTLASGAAAELRIARAFVQHQRAVFIRFASARLAMRTEAGQLSLGGRSWTWLRAHEGIGHTLNRHAGRTNAELMARYAERPSLKGSSTFTDERTAARAIGELLDARGPEMAAWMRSEDETLTLVGRADWIVGRHADPNGAITDVKGVRVFMVKDSSMPDGYRIITGYPVK